MLELVFCELQPKVKSMNKTLMVAAICFSLISVAGAAESQPFLSMIFVHQRVPPPPGVLLSATDRNLFWISPSISADFISIDLDAKTYRAGVIPGVGYGVRFSPSWWTATASFLALDLFFSGAVQNNPDPHASGPQFFAIDVLAVLTAVDAVGVGIGLRNLIPIDGHSEGTTHAILTFGLRTSTHNPNR